MNTRPLQQLAIRYGELLVRYLADRDEAVRSQAYELGRWAVAEQLGPCALSSAHADVLREALARAAPAERPTVVEAANELLVETLSPFDMTQRDSEEANRSLAELNAALQRRLDDLERTREALALSEERYSLLVSELTDHAFIALSADGVVESWNKGARRIDGWRAMEVLGRHYSLLFPEDERAADLTEDLLRQAREGGRFEHTGWRVRRDGTRYFGHTVVTALRDEDGHLRGFSLLTHDVTDKRRAEELRIARDAAEAASAAKSRFLATMSHELRTPLNSVIGFARQLHKNKKGNLDGGQLHWLERIVHNGVHLLSVINQVLDLAKIEAGRMDLSLAPVSLDAVIAEAVEVLRPEADQKGLTLTTAVPASLAPTLADAGKLRQVLLNLLGNAIKFTERGSVTLTVRPGEGGAPARVEIADTGIGIPTDKLDLIFDAFQQVDSARDRRFGGTGLGLTISRALLHEMGFALEVRSEVGVGSTFAIVLRGEDRPSA